MYFFCKKFAYIKNLFYLCTRFRKLTDIILNYEVKIHKCVFYLLMIRYNSQITTYLLITKIVPL